MGVCVCTNIDICSCGGGVAASSISTPGNTCDRIGIAKLASFSLYMYVRKLDIHAAVSPKFN